MESDYASPLDLFKDRLEEEHRESTSALFENLVETAGIDEKANFATVSNIRLFENKRDNAKSDLTKWRWLRGLNIFSAITTAVLVLDFSLTPLLFMKENGNTFLFYQIFGADQALLFFLICGLISAINFWFLPKLKRIVQTSEAKLEAIKVKLKKENDKAWSQMYPLNELYEWSTIPEIVSKTIPNFVLDPFFSTERLSELKQSFGWNNLYHNENYSTIFCQSGAVNGNPFFLVKTNDFKYVDKTYEGSLTISWQEQEAYTDENDNTRYRTVTRTETLYASIVKPAPNYTRVNRIIYGNEAAPELNFSRRPNPLSGQGDGLFDGGALRRRIKKLKKKSRELDGFMLMPNEEFDALFDAVDRDNEQQFRLLFTHLAQEEMVKILRDKEVGFGDNFDFIKRNKINIVRPDHLKDIDISASPDIFQDYDIVSARENFNEYSNDYFKYLYFSFAPIFAIPLYQFHRSHQEVYKDTYAKTATSWEHESIANYFGCQMFEHPDSVTESILKTKVVESTPNTGTRLSVEAHGFRGVDRVAYVEVHGGDGRYHDVPVHWTEYIPVSKTSSLVCKETESLSKQEFTRLGGEKKLGHEWDDFMENWGVGAGDGYFRKSILSFIPMSRKNNK